VSAALSRVVCIIPAKDEEARIAATVGAARDLPGVELVIVCDDGSSDGTAQHAGAAGAIVVSHKRNRGKAAAVESAVNALGVLEQRDSRLEAGTLLLLDADLGESAANCAPLINPVVTGAADLTIAVLPAQQTADGSAAGGFGLVMTTASRGIAELTGWTPRAPLSGQRCLTRRVFELASPLAAGWGMEVGMTIDVLRAGLAVQCAPVLPVPLLRQSHRPDPPARPRQRYLSQLLPHPLAMDVRRPPARSRHHRVTTRGDRVRQ